MTRQMNHWQILALLLLGIVVGCNGPTEDPEITAQREKYLLPQEPDGAVDIAQAKLAAAEEFVENDEPPPEIL
jgi:hypothetical protein